MRRLASIVAAILLLGSAPAFAQAWGSYMVQAQGQQTKKGQGQYKGGGKDFQREKGGRPPRDERQPGHGRMTDEQRRELHRDLDRANREIYRGKSGGW